MPACSSSNTSSAAALTSNITTSVCSTDCGSTKNIILSTAHPRWSKPSFMPLEFQNKSTEAQTLLIRSVLARLGETFGVPEWRNPQPPVDELVCTILSQNTNDRNRDIAFTALKKRFSAWEEVIDADEAEIVSAI